MKVVNLTGFTVYILDALANFRRATAAFVTYIRPPACTNHVWAITGLVLYSILFKNICLNCILKIRVSLVTEKNDEIFS